MGRIFINVKKKLTPWVILTLSLGYIHAYGHYMQTSLLVYNLRSQVSVYRAIGPSSFYLFSLQSCHDHSSISSDFPS